MALSLKLLRSDPAFDDLSDAELVSAYAKMRGTDLDAAAKEMGWKSGGLRQTVGDALITGAKAGTGVVEAAIGLANIPTGGAVGKKLAEYGVDAGKFNQFLTDEYYSPEMQRSIMNAQSYRDPKAGVLEGVGQGIKGYALNPRAAVGAVGESLGLMKAGAMLGARVLPSVLGTGTRAAIGEGAVMAGSAAEGIRQQAPDAGYEGSGYAALAGVGGALLGRVGNIAARRAGIVDPDEWMMGQAARRAAGEAAEQTPMGLARRASSGAAIELAEEMPQSMWEQGVQNVATGKPWAEGVGYAGGQGAVLGAAMGGAMNVVRRGAPQTLTDPNTTAPTLDEQRQRAIPIGTQGELFESPGAAETYLPPSADAIMAARRQQALAEAEGIYSDAARGDVERTGQGDLLRGIAPTQGATNASVSQNQVDPQAQVAAQVGTPPAAVGTGSVVQGVDQQAAQAQQGQVAPDWRVERGMVGDGAPTPGSKIGKMIAAAESPEAFAESAFTTVEKYKNRKVTPEWVKGLGEAVLNATGMSLDQYRLARLTPARIAEATQKLTDRQKEVLTALAEAKADGLSDASVAERLGIEPPAIPQHRKAAEARLAKILGVAPDDVRAAMAKHAAEARAANIEEASIADEALAGEAEGAFQAVSEDDELKRSGASGVGRPTRAGRKLFEKYATGDRKWDSLTLFEQVQVSDMARSLGMAETAEYNAAEGEGIPIPKLVVGDATRRAVEEVSHSKELNPRTGQRYKQGHDKPPIDFAPETTSAASEQSPNAIAAANAELAAGAAQRAAEEANVDLQGEVPLLDRVMQKLSGVRLPSKLDIATEVENAADEWNDPSNTVKGDPTFDQLTAEEQLTFAVGYIRWKADTIGGALSPQQQKANLVEGKNERARQVEQRAQERAAKAAAAEAAAKSPQAADTRTAEEAPELKRRFSEGELPVYPNRPTSFKDAAYKPGAVADVSRGRKGKKIAPTAPIVRTEEDAKELAARLKKEREGRADRPAQGGDNEAAVAMLQGAPSLEQAVKWFGSNTGSGVYKAITNLLLKLAPKGVTVKYVNELKTDKDGNPVAASYDSGNKLLTVYRGGANAKNFFHETVHIATVARLDEAEFYNTQMIKLGKKPEDVLKTAEQKELWYAYRDLTHLMKSAQVQAAKAQGDYGFTNVHEFVAEALTNPKFQQVLKGIKARSPTTYKLMQAWEWFTKNIKQLLESGLGVKLDGTALGSAIDLSGVFISPDPGAGSRRVLEDRYTFNPTAQPENFGSKVAHAMMTMGKVGAQWVENRAMFLHDLIDRAVTKGLTTAKGFNDLMTTKETVRLRMENDAEKIMVAAHARGVNTDKVNKFLEESTVSQKWGFQPAWKKDEVPLDSAMRAKWNALKPEEQSVVERVFQFNEDAYNAIRNETEAQIKAEYDRRAALADERIKAAAGDQTKIDKITKQNDEMKADHDAAVKAIRSKLPRLEGPYAPLGRFGKYVVVGTSPEYKAAREKGDEKEMNRLIELDTGDKPPHYFVKFFDNAVQADAFKRNVLTPIYGAGNVVAKEKQEHFGNAQELPWAAIQKVKNAISHLDATEDTATAGYRRALDKLVTDIYLQQLADTSARKGNMHRKTVAGYEENMLRSFAARASSNAHYIASMRYNDKIKDQIARMQEQAAKSDNLNPYFNELMRRHELDLEYRPTPIADKVMAGTSAWMLLSTPSYPVQNSLQPFMLSMPWIAAQNDSKGNAIGWTRAFNTFYDVYRQLGTGMMNPFKELDFSDPKLGLSKAEQNLLNDQMVKGRIDITTAQELGQWVRAGNPGPVGTAIRKVRAIVQRVETINRVTTALTAYRLTGNVNTVEKAIDKTHGNYTSAAAPRFFSNTAMSKIATQFKKFQLMQLSLVVGETYKAFRSTDANERAVARRVLLYTMPQMAILTGMKGLPIPAIAYTIIAALGSDDEEPADFDRWLREQVGSETAELLKYGIAGEAISKRVGMGNTWSILPYSDADMTTERGFMEAAFQFIGGPAAGIASSALRGYEQIKKGDYWKGAEQMLPRGVRDAMRAYRFNDEGITNSKGDTLIPSNDLDAADILLQAVGVPPQKILTRQAMGRELYKFESFYEKRYETLRHMYVQAAKDGDVEEKRAILEEWLQVSDAERRLGFKVRSADVLYRAEEAQKQRERNTVRGMQYNDQNRRFVEKMMAD